MATSVDIKTKHFPAELGDLVTVGFIEPGEIAAYLAQESFMAQHGVEPLRLLATTLVQGEGFADHWAYEEDHDDDEEEEQSTS